MDGLIRIESGRRAAVQLPLADEAGNALNIESVYGTLTRVTGESVIDRILIDHTAEKQVLGGPSEGTAAGAVEVIIDGSLTALQSPESGKSEGLFLDIEIALVGGGVIERDFLIAIATDMLVPWVSSVDKYRPTMVALTDLPIQLSENILAMTKAERQRALVDSFASLLALPLVVRADGKYRGKRFAALTAPEREEVAKLDPAFVQAMQRAQLVEACELVDEDPVSRARRMGLVSMTVGESSQFFGSGKSLEATAGVVSRQVMKLLAGWLDYSVKVTRG